MVGYRSFVFREVLFVVRGRIDRREVFGVFFVFFFSFAGDGFFSFFFGRILNLRVVGGLGLF